jgi:putative colanic acid biosynthesis glycosyltransferase WcaI
VRILFLTENYPPERNASAARVYERACYWVKWGHEVTVLTCAPNFPEGKVFPGYRNKWYQVEIMDGIRVVRVKTFIAANEGIMLRTLDFLSFMGSAMVAGLFQVSPDVIISTSPQFFAAVGGWGLAGLRGKPFIFELGDLWPASIAAVGAMGQNVFLRWMERLELFLYRRSSAVIALTSSFKEDLVRRGISPKKIAVVINGVDIPRYAPRPRDVELAKKYKLDEHFVIGYIGTHGMAHVLEKVLDVAERMERLPDVLFLFVGGGAGKAKLEEDLAKRKLKNVVLVPPQPKERMPEFWSLCSVALVHLKDTPVFASVIPSKIFEAMGMGLPILLASPKGEASRIVEKEEAGLWVPAEDPAALEEGILRLKNDSEFYRHCASRSHAAAPRYSRERQARDVLKVAAEAAKGNGGVVGIGESA